MPMTRKHYLRALRREAVWDGRRHWPARLEWKCTACQTWVVQPEHVPGSDQCIDFMHKNLERVARQRDEAKAEAREAKATIARVLDALDDEIDEIVEARR